MSHLQNHYNFKLDFHKVDQHAGGKWLIHSTKHHKDNQLHMMFDGVRLTIHQWRTVNRTLKQNVYGNLNISFLDNSRGVKICNRCMSNDHKWSHAAVNTFCFVLCTPSYVLWRKRDKQILGHKRSVRASRPF